MRKSKYGLIGYPLGHSYSKKFFEEKFEREGIEAEYLLYELPSLNTRDLLPDINGFNVTIPYKESIISLLDDISDEAKEIGAVNVVKRFKNEEGNPILKGYNTDAAGFETSLMNIEAFRRGNYVKALVLGTGGASKAIAYVLKSKGIEVTFVSRKKSSSALEYTELTEEIIKSHLLIVNCTPLGTFPNTEECPPIPYDFIGPNHLCLDLVYNPSITSFMKKCAERGAIVKNGLEMLHNQALETWRIWNEDNI